LVALVVLEERGVPDALSDGGSAGSGTRAYVMLVCFFRIQGYFEVSEGTSAKWIFKVNIEMLRAEVMFTCLEDKNYFLCLLVTTDKALKTKI
jgi:hypothetical protein